MVVASIARRPVTVGVILWLVGLAALPAPVIARLALAGPLVLVPRLGPVLADSTSRGAVAPAAAWPWLAIVTAGLAALSFAVPTGSPAAGALATPWVLVALGGAVTALVRLRLWTSMPLEVSWRWVPVPQIGTIAADLFLLAGAGFLWLDRMELVPFGFDATIGLLTVAHFSVAGFGLVAIAVLLAGQGSRPAAIGALGLVAGIPLTALGWFVGTPLAAWPGATLVAISGLLVALALVGQATGSASRRVASTTARAALATGMVLAITWSSGLVLGGTDLTLELMVRTHGVLNLAAVLVAALLLGGRARTPFHRRPLRGTTRAGTATLIAAIVAGVLIVADRGLEPRPGGDLSRVIPAAALVGAAVPAWWLAGSRLDPRRRPVRSGIALGLLAVPVACAVTVADQVLRTGGRELLGGLGLFVAGLVVIGPLASVVSVPCGLAWGWAFRRRPRPAR